MLKDYPSLVTITWSDELAAICLKWHTEYDPGDRVIDAVKFALAYVAEHDVRHWWVDLSTSRAGLKESDQHWVETKFGGLVAASPLTRLAMTPPLPETGQDTAWLDDWEANTNAKYAGRIRARLVAGEEEALRHFLDAEDTP